MLLLQLEARLREKADEVEEVRQELSGAKAAAEEAAVARAALQHERHTSNDLRATAAALQVSRVCHT
jgi:hypothetical protein